MMSVRKYENSQRTNWAAIVLGNIDLVESETVVVVQTIVVASIWNGSVNARLTLPILGYAGAGLFFRYWCKKRKKKYQET